MKKIFVFLVLFLVPSGLMAAPIIVDHNAVKAFDDIPDHWLEKAKELTVHYGHTSHGSQIIAGLNWLESNVDSVRYKFACSDRNSSRNPELPSQTNPPSLRMWEEGLWPYTEGDRLGYWDGQAAVAGTDAVLNSGLFDISGWSWCGQVGDEEWSYIQQYLDAMQSFEQKHPDVVFFYMTGHRVEPGPPNHQQIKYDRLQANNQEIRDFCIANDKILFDFADIEAHDLAGNYYPEEDASCVWCADWCNSHPGDCQNLPPESGGGGGCGVKSCGHSHGLNCVIKAKAFWYMMARIAGWEPGGPPPPDPPNAPQGLRMTD